MIKKRLTCYAFPIVMRNSGASLNFIGIRMTYFVAFAACQSKDGNLFFEFMEMF